ncbi:MAG: DUF4864 domain-containing protein [Paracoccaceae bacterium]
MRQLAMAFGLVALLAGPPVAAQEAGIEGTIRSQIDAFLADDFATAFTFASPMIKGIFGNPDNFGMMVRQGYPMVWRPSDVRFLDLKDIGGRSVQRVQILDQAGVPYIAEYEMIQTVDGWQINGVRIEQAPEVGA